MEQPAHDLRSHIPAQGPNRARRTGILIGVGILHVGLIWALVVGLASGLIQKLPEELKAEIVQTKEVVKPPPPPPPDLAKPPPPFVPAPELNIASDTVNNAITAVQATVPTQPAPVQQPTIMPSKAVGHTHDCQTFYPDLSRRLNESGDVLVHYDVGADGAITNVGVSTSSGSDRLDQAAVSCVSTRWRNTPAMNGATPVASPNHEAIVRFSLH